MVENLPIVACGADGARVGEASRSASSGGFAARLQWLAHDGAFRPAIESSVTPAIADRIEAMKTAILAASKSASDQNASPAMNSDIVNPIPATAPAPASC